MNNLKMASARSGWLARARWLYGFGFMVLATLGATACGSNDCSFTFRKIEVEDNANTANAPQDAGAEGASSNDPAEGIAVPAAPQ